MLGPGVALVVSLIRERSIVDRYCRVWNEADPSIRAELLGSVWASDATYTDPSVHAASAEELLKHIAAVRALGGLELLSFEPAPLTLIMALRGSRGTSCKRTERRYLRESTSRLSRQTARESSEIFSHGCSMKSAAQCAHGRDFEIDVVDHHVYRAARDLTRFNGTNRCRRESRDRDREDDDSAVFGLFLQLR